MTTPPFAFATAMVIATLVAFSTAGQDDEPAPLPETVQPVPSSETRSRPAGWGRGANFGRGSLSEESVCGGDLWGVGPGRRSAEAYMWNRHGGPT